MDDRTAARLDLLRFVPFRLNRLAAEFSAALAEEYIQRFGLDVPEWRVIATLGMRIEPRSAQYIVRCTRTHKSRISRAVAHLVEMELIERSGGEGARREIELRLTGKGRTVYAQLVPLLLAKEERLLSALDGEERTSLALILGKLERSLSLVAYDD